MDQDQKEKYMHALAIAVALVSGPRDEDYNKGGIELRDYWKVNGIRSPLQMVDMKLKRALSQVATWDTEQMGADMPLPRSKEQVEKLTESMVDLINYAAFVVCEAVSLYEDNRPGDVELDLPNRDLAMDLRSGLEAWKKRKAGCK